MKSPALLLSSSLATCPAELFCEKVAGSHPIAIGSSGFCRLLSILLAFLFLSTNLKAQNDSLSIDTTNGITTTRMKHPSRLPSIALISPKSDSTYYPVSSQQKKKRIWLVAGGNVVAYGGTMVGLYSAWYKNYPQTGIHSFNDWPEWKQVDKVGHLYSAYIESRASMELWRWTGIDRKKRIWIGGMSGAFYQTVIEILDGFSAGWGWSWADFGANILGSGALVAQEFAWNDQRIKLKFSFHNKIYKDPELNRRSDLLFGETASERFIKDYNGQTYWASANLKSFFPKSNLPPWLSLSLGYGAEGLFGGTQNIAKDANGNITFNRSDIKRYRQWYLAPDIDLSKIKTNSKGLKFFLTFLSAFKFPAPALEFSNGKFKAHVIAF